jgi:ABC-type protease/lipase transport system fused ATPase/permease subunit
LSETSGKDFRASQAVSDLNPSGNAMTLRGINLSIKRGEFVGIIGDFRSGKSSLIQAIIGDMLYTQQTTLDQLQASSC